MRLLCRLDGAKGLKTLIVHGVGALRDAAPIVTKIMLDIRKMPKHRNTIPV